MKAEQIKTRILEFDPKAEIQVQDLTGTEDHWQVQVASSEFRGKSRIEQHQWVMNCFAPELKTGEVHALSIQTKTLS